jgi:prepilin-type N-terminal cleavage/methylation domain-containing protein
MNLVRGFDVIDSETGSARKCLRYCDIKRIDRAISSGFTLIETLIVVLVLGVLCATGVSMYAGATNDSQLRSLTDEINSFFKACQHRAKFRKTPVRVEFQNSLLGIEQSNTLKLRIPELADFSGDKLNGMLICSTATFDANGKPLKNIELQVILPGNRPATISLEL